MTPMRRRHTLCIVITLALGGGVSAILPAQTPAPRRNIDSLLGRMTLEEKLGQLNLPSVDNRPSAEQLELLRKGLVGGFLNLTGAAATRGRQRAARTESRLSMRLRVGAADAVMATAKHFAAYGGAEGGRDYNAVDVSERTLREIYLPPFRAAVEAGAGSIMTSFNEIAGTPSHANRWLVTALLRGEWKFSGLVVSDWTGVEELRGHGVAGSRADAGKLALETGADMDMGSRIYADDLPRLVG